MDSSQNITLNRHYVVTGLVAVSFFAIGFYIGKYHQMANDQLDSVNEQSNNITSTGAMSYQEGYADGTAVASIQQAAVRTN